MLELFLAPSTSSEAIYLLFMLSVSITQSSPVSTLFLYRVFCDFWLRCWVEIFGSRSTLFRPILHDTRLTSGFIGIFRFYRWSPHFLSSSTLPPLAFPRPGFQWFPTALAILAGGSQPAPLNRLSVVGLAVVYLCYLDYCFPLCETTAFKIVLVSLFTAIIFPYSNNVFTIYVIFWWLLQASSGDAIGLVLIYFSFTFETTLCGPLKGPGHLFVKFSTFCKYLNVVFVSLGLMLGSPPLFH